MGLFEKVSNLFYKEEDYDDDEMMEEEEYEEQPAPRARRPLSTPNERSSFRESSHDYERRTRKNNMISIPTRGNHVQEDQLEIVLVRATSYDDMQAIANDIKDEKVVIVNFEDMDKTLAQRMVDFLSGAVFALDGMPKKVSGGTFIFSSSKVDMSGQIMEGGVSFSRFAESRQRQTEMEQDDEEPRFRAPRFFGRSR